MKAETDESGTPGSLVGSTPLTSESDGGTFELVGAAGVDFEDFSANFGVKWLIETKRNCLYKNS